MLLSLLLRGVGMGGGSSPTPPTAIPPRPFLGIVFDESINQDRGHIYVIPVPLPPTPAEEEIDYTLRRLGRDPRASTRTRRIEDLAQINFDTIVSRVDAMDAAATGPTGATGPQGPPGATGATGATGAAGADGSTWVKYTATYADFSAAAITKTVTLVTMDAQTYIIAIVVKHSVAFSGGTIASYAIDVGVTGNNTLFITAFDAFSSVADTNHQVSGSSFQYASIGLTVTAGSAVNLNQATAGSVDVWVLLGVLP